MTTDTRLHVVTVPNPAGELTVAVEGETGVVRGTSFRGIDDIRARLGAAMTDAITTGPRPPAARRVAEVFARYAAGEIEALDELEVAQPGGAFMQRAWEAMRRVRGVVTYADIASAAGSPTAYRAAGSACARNLVPVVVPCHRILTSARAIGGYYFGTDVKHALLAHEGALEGVRG